MKSLKGLVALLVTTLVSCHPLALPVDHSRPLPTLIFPSLCQAFIQDEGYDSSTSTLVLRETRPIFNTFALRLLYGVGNMTPSEVESDDKRDTLLRDQFAPRTVLLPQTTGQCHWSYPTGTDEEAFGSTQLILELSNIVEDPFTDPRTSPYGQYGIFARLSLGYQSGGSWYWISLDRSGNTWRVSKVSRLDVSDG